jgi:hypothetical protein
MLSDDAPPKSRMAQVVTGGALGVALVTAGRLLWRATDPANSANSATTTDRETNRDSPQ